MPSAVFVENATTRLIVALGPSAPDHSVLSSASTASPFCPGSLLTTVTFGEFETNPNFERKACTSSRLIFERPTTCNRLSRAIHAACVQRIHVVDGGEICGRQIVVRSGIKLRRVKRTQDLLPDRRRLVVEIMQLEYSVHNRRHGGGNLRIACVRDVMLSSNRVAAYGCVECGRHLIGRSAEYNRAPACRNFFHPETLASQRRRNLRDIVL